MLSINMDLHRYLIASRDMLSQLTTSIVSWFSIPVARLLDLSPSKGPKIWLPGRFAIGAKDTKNVEEQFAVLVLNQPIENKALFIQLCERGIDSWDTCWTMLVITDPF